MLIRRFSPQDAQSCCDVINSCVPSMQGLNAAARFHILTKNVPADFIADIADTYALVVELHRQIVAVGALDGDVIRRVYVCPDVQGQGVGQAIMEALETEAAKRGIGLVRVEVVPSAIDFYEKLGYVQQGINRSEVGKAVFEYMRMTKELKGESAAV
jgi:GNAT superfamily N-acetyltransferase